MQKHTKKALTLSVLSLVLCVSMLVGTTFAWFTDSVTTGVNTIQSGTLDIALEYSTDDGKTWVDAEGETLNFMTADNRTTDILWEPGCTYVLPTLRLRNNGNLALKYNFVVNGVDGDAKLLEAIEWEIKIGDAEPVTLANYSGTLLTKDAASEKLVISGHMKEEAGNEYQGLEIKGIGITVFATQMTEEFDSFNNQYDKMATIDDEAELAAALAADYDLIVLGADVELTEGIVIPAGKKVTLDLAGFDLTQSKVCTTAHAMITVKGELTVADTVGTGKISFEDIGTGGEYASNTIRNEGVLNVVSGTIENVTSEAVMKVGYPHAIDAYQGSVTNVTGGTVKSANYDSIRMFCNSETLATEVNISGGTIVNRVTFQDPAANRAGYGILNITGGNFVTTDGVSANVRLLNFSNVSSNMKATVTGGTFDKGFKTQDIVGAGVANTAWINVTGGTYAVDPTAFVADGYKAVAVGDKFEIVKETVSYATASTAAELQAALDNAANENLIVLTADIVGDVRVKQINGLVITVNGDGHEFNGVFLVDGASAQEETSGVTLKNINFVADEISADACIQLGNGTNTTRYTCNVTVDNCTFDASTDNGKVAIKSYTGGDVNLVVTGCTTSANIHSLGQWKGIQGVTVKDCTVKSIRGINFQNSLDILVEGCTIDVQKYALRFGADVNSTVESYTVKNTSLKSAGVGGDPVIEIRAGATNANLTLENVTIEGPIEMTGHENANIVIK